MLSSDNPDSINLAIIKVWFIITFHADGFLNESFVISSFVKKFLVRYYQFLSLFLSITILYILLKNIAK